MGPVGLDTAGEFDLYKNPVVLFFSDQIRAASVETTRLLVAPDVGLDLVSLAAEYFALFSTARSCFV